MKTNEKNKCTALFEKIPNSDESCRQEYSLTYLHFVLLFRRFRELENIMKTFSDMELKEKLEASGPKGYEWITPSICALWNLDYITAYDEKNGTQIRERLMTVCWKNGMPSGYRPLLEYTDHVCEGKSVFDIIWGNCQPMLDVIDYEKQRVASQQVQDHNYSIVLDEVGTGKTVTALYALRDVIEECNEKEEAAKILIVCPYNKRADWQNDIRRQLGRYAHIVEQSDDGSIYLNLRKKGFFRDGEHIIFICGPKQSSKDKNGSNSALKGSLEEFSFCESWDLAIIDEAHLSFSNYGAIRSDKVMLLTATPIVVNSMHRRSLEEYKDLAKRIIDTKNVNTQINPVSIRNPEKDCGFVNWFREDMGREAVRRNIIFVECEREEWRRELFTEISESKGMLTALSYDQDDEYLLSSAKSLMEKGELEKISDLPVQVCKNKKIEKLIDILNETDRVSKSYIIFCEHTEVARRIFERLRNEKGIIAAKKTGKGEEQVGLTGIREGQLLDSLILAIRAKKRVVLVLTGKIGGTGLNLGEFDGVIHYELPYTSIDLEQRYGRVDRIDSKERGGDEKKEKEMIFLLNKCGQNEYDMEINRMLYYCTTKIDIACQYMPIRNTILFYPDMIEKEYHGILETMKRMKEQSIWNREDSIKKQKKQLNEIRKDIENSKYWDEDILKQNNDFSRACQEFLARPMGNDKEYEELCEKIDGYLKEINKYDKINDPFQKEKRRFSREMKKAISWMKVVGIIETDEESDIFFRGDEEQINSDNNEEIEKEHEEAELKVLKQLEKKEEADEDSETKEKSILEQIEDFLDKLQAVNLDTVALNGEGVFWYDKLTRKICRSTVEMFRKEDV